MDSQIERPHYDQEPRNAALQAEIEDEHPTEKKSVLKKVKAKARKIKDTLKLHAHGQGHDHDRLQHEGQVPDDHDLDEEDDEEDDEEMAHDPEIHEGSALGSAAVKSSLPVQVEKFGGSAETKDSLGYSQPKVADSSSAQSSLPGQVENLRDSGETKDYLGYSEPKVADSSVQSSFPNPEQDKGIKLPISDIKEEPYPPVNTPASALGSAAVKSSLPVQVEKFGDSAETKDSLGYSQPKVVDSSLAQSSLPGQVENLRDSGETKDYLGYSQPKVADSSVQSSFPNPEQDKGIKLPISDIKEEPYAPVNTLATITPRTVEQTKTVDPVGSYAREQKMIRGEPEMRLGERMNLEKDPHAPKERPEDYSPSNYQTKVTDPTGAGGAEADVTPIVRSLEKVNVSDEPKREALDKSIFPTGSHDQFSAEPTPPITISTQEKIESISEEPDSVSNASDNDTAQKTSKQGTTYTEKISSATSVISDKAVSAKNVVASKLGYGERDNTSNREQVGEGQAKGTSPVEYGKKIAATVTEKLSPVYEKVAGTGSNVMSKVPGMGTGAAKGEESKIRGQDEGVSVKNYLSEKLKPGEEDKALSEVISETLHKQKPTGNENGNKRKPISEVISGALHKQKPEEENGNENKVTGKVTESEQVKRRLGSTEDTSDEKACQDSTHLSGASPTVVDKLKGVVGSFLGRGTGTHDSSTGAQVGSGEEAGERRLQESGN